MAGIVTLKDAIVWLVKAVPKSEHTMKQIQAAAHCVTEAAENGGPLLFARMGMMQAINRHKPEEFDPKQKSSHWGKTQACEGPMKDAFDLWWEWAEKPHESLLMIDADLHRPIMELSPEDRRNREKVNEAGRRYRESPKCST